jgi:hypothetical protein
MKFFIKIIGVCLILSGFVLVIYPYLNPTVGYLNNWGAFYFVCLELSGIFLLLKLTDH